MAAEVYGVCDEGGVVRVEIVHHNVESSGGLNCVQSGKDKTIEEIGNRHRIRPRDLTYRNPSLPRRGDADEDGVLRIASLVPPLPHSNIEVRFSVIPFPFHDVEGELIVVNEGVEVRPEDPRRRR